MLRESHACVYGTLALESKRPLSRMCMVCASNRTCTQELQESDACSAGHRARVIDAHCHVLSNNATQRTFAVLSANTESLIVTLWSEVDSAAPSCCKKNPPMAAHMLACQALVCSSMHGHVCRHVCGHARGHANGHVYRHVYTDGCQHVGRHIYTRV